MTRKTIALCQGEGITKLCTQNLFAPLCKIFAAPPPLLGGEIITEGGKHLLPSFIMIWLSVYYLAFAFFLKH